VEGHRLLGLVRMVRTGVDLELVHHAPAEAAFGQHAADGVLHQPLGMLAEHLAVRLGLQPARIPGEARLEPLLGLAAGHDDLRRIRNDHVVAAVDERRVIRAVLAHQHHGDLSGHPAEHLALGVVVTPLAVDVGGLGERRLTRHDATSGSGQIKPMEQRSATSGPEIANGEE